MRDSPWFFPVITLSAIVWSYGIAYTAYEAGYKRASVKAEEQQQYVNRKMDEIGFCAWVEQSEFVQYCQGCRPRRPRSSRPCASGGGGDE